MAKNTQTTRTRNNDIRDKEYLFDDFFRVCYGTMESLEHSFNIKGVVEQIYGVGHLHSGAPDTSEAKAKVRQSTAWHFLDRMYEYALNGVEDPTEDGASVTIDGSNVIKLCTSENWSPCLDWEKLIWMADGRFALDDGSPVDAEKVAILANVDLRTVRNAISAGELEAQKDPFTGRTNVENSSARRWLMTRKGFKPTVSQAARVSTLDSVNTSTALGAFLKQQRSEVYSDDAAGTLVPRHPKVKAEAIAALESGVFDLPLDAVFPLADFYQVPRRLFLDSVMRIFFPNELAMLEKGEAQ